MLGEKVLCFHGPLIYEAKCLKSSVTKDKLVRYFIHYAGWNKNWDEWVPESRVLKYNDANVQKQREVLGSHRSCPKTNAKKNTKGRKSEIVADEGGPSASVKEESTPKGSKHTKDKEASADHTAEPPKKKRGRIEQPVEQPAEPKEAKVSQTKITLPEDVKKILVNDWHLIVKQQKLMKLPVKRTITQLFEDYTSATNSTSEESVSAVKGIKDYFNHSLSKQLLYETELDQFKELVEDREGEDLCAVYGVTHLLRMFTKLGDMLAHLEMEEKSQQFVMDFIKQFITYVSDNKSDLFSPDDYVSK